jgi:hypothetical protein
MIYKDSNITYKTGERTKMRELTATSLLLLLLVSLVTPVCASVTIQATIDQNIHVVFDFQNIDSTTYNAIIHQHLFDISTIPRAIEEDLEERDLKNAECKYDPAQEIFDDSTRSIRVEFLLVGSDIIHITINRTTTNKIYNVRTDWRKFHVNLTDNYALDFNEYFGRPIVEWKFENKTTPVHYYYNHTSSIEFDPICYFTLPSRAINPHIAEDMETIVFELPLPLGESLLSSPFLILVALIIVNVVAVLYRKVRR